MINALGRKINLLLSKTGFRLQSISDSAPSVVDVRAAGNDPRSILYYARYRPVLIDAAFSCGRGLLAFPLAAGSSHPFVYAVSQALNSSNCEHSLTESMERYYAEVRPVNAAEYLGLTDLAVPQLYAVPPRNFVFPWVTQSLECRIAQKKAARHVAFPSRIGAGDVPVAFGWKDCGPATPQLLRNEVQRLLNLMRSIDRNGHARHDGAGGDILAVAMIGTDGTWRWRVGSGHHRAAVLSAFGYRTVPVRLVAIVNRNDVAIWPNVQSGLYSEAAALTVFDNVFYGTLPPAFSAWKRYVENKGGAAPKSPKSARKGLHPVIS
jgi:hypothetical protein